MGIVTSAIVKKLDQLQFPGSHYVILHYSICHGQLLTAKSSHLSCNLEIRKLLPELLAPRLK